jgi:hypothetical protein
LLNRFYSRIFVDTDGKRFVDMVFQDILDPVDVNSPYFVDETLAGSPQAKICR